MSTSFWSACLVPSEGPVGDRTNEGGRDTISALRDARGWARRNATVKGGPDKARVRELRRNSREGEARFMEVREGRSRWQVGTGR